MTVDRYVDSLKPIIYRVNYSNSETTGQLIAIDYIKNGRPSKVELFDNVRAAEKYISNRQKGDDYYYLHIPRWQGLGMRLGGLDTYNLNDKELNTARLSEALKAERYRRTREAHKVDDADG